MRVALPRHAVGRQGLLVGPRGQSGDERGHPHGYCGETEKQVWQAVKDVFTTDGRYIPCRFNRPRHLFVHGREIQQILVNDGVARLRCAAAISVAVPRVQVRIMMVASRSWNPRRQQCDLRASA